LTEGGDKKFGFKDNEGNNEDNEGDEDYSEVDE
jgi:hypothetical protein